ncbi:MAG: hypothetical protein CMF75_09665 [Maricaulis sp.]|nr:hypothetical protein [Maricaulis sp.]
MPSLLGPWTLLVIGGVLEMAWAIGFKYVGKDSALRLKAAVGLALAGSMTALFLAMRQLPAGTAYAVWTGIGAIGVATIGIFVFREPATVARVCFLALILVGIIGLKATSSAS